MSHSDGKPRLAGWLLALEGPNRGTVYSLREGKSVMGTGPDHDLRLPKPAELWPNRVDLHKGHHPAVHLTIEERDGEGIFKYFAVATDQVWLNGTLAEHEELIDGDTLVVGTVVFGVMALRLEWWR